MLVFLKLHTKIGSLAKPLAKRPLSGLVDTLYFLWKKLIHSSFNFRLSFFICAGIHVQVLNAPFYVQSIYL